MALKDELDPKKNRNEVDSTKLDEKINSNLYTKLRPPVGDLQLTDAQGLFQVMPAEARALLEELPSAVLLALFKSTLEAETPDTIYPEDITARPELEPERLSALYALLYPTTGTDSAAKIKEIDKSKIINDKNNKKPVNFINLSPLERKGREQS